MQRRRGVLLAALVGSAALHLFAVAGGTLGLPDVFPSADDVLTRRAATTIRPVRLVAATPSRAPAPSHRTPPRRPIPAVQAPASVTTAIEPETTPTPPTPTETAAQVPRPPTVTSPATQPAPAFPVQMQAVLEARYNNFPFSIQQTWLMEGLRYSIDLQAARFGVHFRLSSEGNVNPQGGIEPAHYRLLLNDKMRAFADYADGELRYGRPEATRNGRLITAPQDMASLPFHLAATFRGAPQTLIVTTGNGVYEIRLTADAEEELALPAGTLRTLHLRGERYDVERGRMQTGYEVWLALDYLNYPVKFVGITGNGDRLEYRLKQLDIEGRRVLEGGAALATDDDAVPDWLRRQALQEGLNNH